MEIETRRATSVQLRLYLLCLMSLLLPLLPYSSASADDQITEYELKAAYLFNFLKFVEWPAEKRPEFSEISVCAFSTDPLLPYLRSLERKKVRNHGITVNVYDSVEDIGACQLIYFHGVSIAKRADILKSIEGKPVLSVGEEGEYPDSNEIINFFTESGKLRFDINYRAVRESGIDMSSRLLKLARVSEK